MELLDRMFGDTLWIYTAIAGSLFGAAFLAWFQGTRMGLWCYAKFYSTMDYFVQRWNLRIFISDNIAVNFLNSVVVLFHEFVLGGQKILNA